MDGCRDLEEDVIAGAGGRWLFLIMMMTCVCWLVVVGDWEQALRNREDGFLDVCAMKKYRVALARFFRACSLSFEYRF